MKKFQTLILLALISCASPPTAEEIVTRAIAASGTEKLKNAEASFTFRNIEYQYQYRNGNFRYTRIQQDTLGNTVKDVLVNSGLNRFINDSLVTLEEEKRTAYTASVNSVIYFAFLPLPLNDAAVNKSFVGKVEINQKSYFKVQVTFDVEGGGEDYEDVFYYWFDTEDYSLDYLAYSYNEDDGIGVRFREAYNTRTVNGVIVQDYRNYRPENEEGFPLATIDNAFKSESLKLLSVIELEDVQIN